MQDDCLAFPACQNRLDTHQYFRLQAATGKQTHQAGVKGHFSEKKTGTGISALCVQSPSTSVGTMQRGYLQPRRVSERSHTVENSRLYTAACGSTLLEVSTFFCLSCCLALTAQVPSSTSPSLTSFVASVSTSSEHVRVKKHARTMADANSAREQVRVLATRSAKVRACKPARRAEKIDQPADNRSLLQSFLSLLGLQASNG